MESITLVEAKNLAFGRTLQRVRLSWVVTIKEYKLEKKLGKEKKKIHVEK